MACVFLPPPLPPLRNSDWCIRRASYAAQEAFPRVKAFPPRSLPSQRALIGEQWGVSAHSGGWNMYWTVRQVGARLSSAPGYAPKAHSFRGDAGWAGRALAREPGGGRPGQAEPRQRVQDALAKLELIPGIGLPADLFDGVLPHELERIGGVSLPRPPTSCVAIRRRPSSHGSPLSDRTEMEVDRQYVDSHGQSTIAFAFCRLLGFQLMPRLKAIPVEKLSRPEAGRADAYGMRRSVASYARRGRVADKARRHPGAETSDPARLYTDPLSVQF
jgi:hypothetical protein